MAMLSHVPLKGFVWSLTLAAIGSLASTKTHGGPPAAHFPIDPVFETGLAAIRKATGIIEGAGGDREFDWRPNLQLLVGIKAVENAKRTIYFIELTTLSLKKIEPEGQSPSPLHTNRFTFGGGESGVRTNLTFEFVYRLMPVGVRVFDEAGRALERGRTEVPWQLMTNSLAAFCRVSLALQQLKELSSADPQKRLQLLQEVLGGTTMDSVNWQEVMRPVAAGFLSLGGLFAACISVPALNEVCEHARCVIRSPGAWAAITSALGGTLILKLEPEFDQVSLLDSKVAEDDAPQYRFPADLICAKKTLVTVDFVVGQSRAAHVMLGGIRSIRAVHPTKPSRSFTAQVLVAGVAAEKPTDETSIPNTPAADDGAPNLNFR